MQTNYMDLTIDILVHARTAEGATATRVARCQAFYISVRLKNTFSLKHGTLKSARDSRQG